MIGPKIPRLTNAQEKAAYTAVTARDQGRCVRCGLVGDVERRSGGNTTPVCRDCKGVLSPDERVRWAA